MAVGPQVDPCDKCEEMLQPYLDRELTDAERAEAQIQPITREEAKSEGGQVSSPEVGMLRET